MANKKGIYRVKNSKGEYDVIHLETHSDVVIDHSDRRFTTDLEKATWNNKANSSGDITKDFNVKNLNVSGNITPNTDGNTNIGTNVRRINEINTKKIKTDGVHIGNSEDALSSEAGNVTLKATTGESIVIKTINGGSTSISSQNATDVIGTNSVNVQATGTNGQVLINATKTVNINGSNINLNGTAGLKNTKVTGTLQVTGSTTLDGNFFTAKAKELLINSGETGNGVTDNFAGIVISRGSQSDAKIMFDDTDDSFKVGIGNSLNRIATEDWVTSNTNKYVHPSTHPASMITESDSRQFVALADKEKWNNKEEKGHIHDSSDISDATHNNLPSTIVARNSAGDFSARNITASLTGNADTATKLRTPAKINGIDFDGSEDIVITAEANEHNHDSSYLKLTGGNVSGNITLTTDNTGLNMKDGAKVYKKSGAGLRLKAHNDTTGVTISNAADEDVLVVKDTAITYKSSRVYHEGDKPSLNELGAASSSHKHASADTTSMTGYKKATTISSILVSDSLNTAIGKVEYALDLKANNEHAHAWEEISNKPTVFTPAAHTHDIRDINKMTGYAKPANTSSIVVGDSLNVAIGKLEKALDLKEDSHDHPYRPSTWVPTWSQVTNKPTKFEPTEHEHDYASPIHNHDSVYLKLSGGSMNGNITYNGNNQGITWSRNSDGARIFFKNDSDADADSYLGFETSDNNNEYFKFQHKSSSATTEWMSIKDDGVRIKGNLVYHKGNNPVKGDVGLGNVDNTSDVNKPISNATQTALNNKVDKISGKGLSTNDYTNIDKEAIQALGTASTRNVGTASGQVPVLDSKGKLATSIIPSIAINETFTTTNQTEAMKLTVEVGDIVILTAPTARSVKEANAIADATSTFICVNATESIFDEKFKPLISSADTISKAEVQTALNGKVDKVTGKGLSTNDYTTAEKNKLAGIENNANFYEHPSLHFPNEIKTDASNRFVTDTEKSTWNGKANANHEHADLYEPLGTLHDSRYLRRDSGNAADIRVTSSDGRGLRFWDSDNYKIYMSAQGNASWGGRLDTASDYNMYFKMAGGATRGFVFKNDTNVIAHFEGSGKLFTKGEVYVGTAKDRVYHEGYRQTGQDVSLTGYAKASSVVAVSASDTVNIAIGKLEKAIDSKIGTTNVVFNDSISIITPAN